MHKLTSKLASVGAAAARTLGLGRGAPQGARAGVIEPPAEPHLIPSRHDVGQLIETAVSSAESACAAHASAKLSLDAAEYQLSRLYQEFPEVQALCAAPQRAGERDRDAAARADRSPPSLAA